MRLGPLLEGDRQYVVPYFQRTYSWRRQQWSTLFEDILELYELGSPHSHFLGSMVLLGEHQDGGAPTTLVIDGQQRLVTLSLFLAAIRDATRESDPTFADRIHQAYLVAGDGEVKVVCTHQDRPPSRPSSSAPASPTRRPSAMPTARSARRWPSTSDMGWTSSA